MRKCARGEGMRRCASEVLYGRCLLLVGLLLCSLERWGASSLASLSPEIPRLASTRAFYGKVAYNCHRGTNSRGRMR